MKEIIHGISAASGIIGIIIVLYSLSQARKRGERIESEMMQESEKIRKAVEYQVQNLNEAADRLERANMEGGLVEDGIGKSVLPKQLPPDTYKLPIHNN